jgi:multicomponent Na+:H+ antiporter subunit F
VIAVAAFLIGVASLLAVTAFRRFSDPADRIVAADAFSACAIGACLTAAAYTGEVAFVDVAIGFALVAFLATVGWSYAIEHETGDDRS